MSYGQNQPWGLQAIKTINGATWNGQTSTYLIKSGYPNNIFKGDLVYLANDGYIHNLSDLMAANYGTAAAIGVFNGCSFATTTATNPIDPASPGRPYWPAGTVTFNGIDATCDIIDDPNVIFNVQAAPNGVQFNGQGKTAKVLYTYVVTEGVASTTNPTGNFNTGISSLTLDSSQVGVAANFNLRILRFVPTPGNIPGINYNNVEVLIQNHAFAQRAAANA